MAGSIHPPAGPYGWLNRNVLLLSLSAFFADGGYQAVTSIFSLLIILNMKEPPYVYGLLLALAFGGGSLFAFLGGKAGDRYNRKTVALVGNLLIPLMSLAGFFSNVWIIGILFTLGWWARFFRTPARRAMLVEVSKPEHRTKVFGFLHALDVGGGLIAVVYVIILILYHVSYHDILVVSIFPILLSSVCLALVHYVPFAVTSPSTGTVPASKVQFPQYPPRINRRIFQFVLLAATLFGFSYYALGFPILSVAESQASAALGVLTFGIYLGFSSAAGYVLGSSALRPIRALWTTGYALAGVGSLIIGVSYLVDSGLLLFYLGAALLGIATGAVETFEPVLTSYLVQSGELSGGMGLLGMSRALGLFVSNVVMGVIFTVDQPDSYFYACVTAILGAGILALTEYWLHRKFASKIPSAS
ncbi:MFS transporter [Acidithiobacillus sp. M4-SHS-6]|uniref:MFS transporter n=1 Tax=Acidithiobacillus sp. M4-SHS-6 TaxID=3383024 RepID=UPI0039BDEBA5